MTAAPITTLDKRYSAPDAVATGWDDTCRVLETAELFWLSTVRADGQLHATPVVAVWLDGALHFCTGDTEQKARNIRGNAHVVLTTGCNQWADGLDIVVSGDAVRVIDDERLGQLATAWATKWDGRWLYLVRDGCFFHHDEDEVLPDPIQVFSVTPKQVLAFAKGDFSHTSHQF